LNQCTTPPEPSRLYDTAELDNYKPRVVDVGAPDEILNLDHEVATLLGANDRSEIGAPTA
jgi:hypothetical protein